MFDSEDVDTLRSIHDAAGVAPGDDRTGLFNDTWSTDGEWKHRTSARIAAALDTRLNGVFPDHRPLGFAHIVKWPGALGAVPAHRDPTFVDERQYRSLMMWVPLDDVDVDNGALWVLPGSHRDRTGVRVHQSPDNLLDAVSCDPRGPAHPMPLRAGEVLVYDHALVHLSGPNLGTTPRVAVAAPLVPSSAEVRYAVPTGGTAATIVEVDERFFLDHRLCDLDVETVLREFPVVGAVQPVGRGQRSG